MKIYVYAENHVMSGLVAIPPDQDMEEQWMEDMEKSDDVVLWEGSEKDLIADANQSLKSNSSYYNIKSAYQVLGYLGADAGGA